ncbi:MAG: hypothetical protein JWN23_3278 [Rhodocyclales bacterium]|nr:hypothetical protein [Rhodocyclales bacterium]
MTRRQEIDSAENAAPAVESENAENAVDGSPKSTSLWTDVLKWGAFLLSLGGLILHVAGYSWHSSYVRAWGLDADLFPKPIEWILISGYYVVVNGIAEIFIFLLKNWWMLVLWGSAITLGIFIGVMLSLHGKEKWLQEIVRRHGRRLPQWLQVMCVAWGFSGAVCMLVLAAPVVVVCVLYLPASIGGKAGTKSAQADILQFSKGCADNSQTRPCMALRCEGRDLMRGFLIESSDGQLAVYVAEKKQVQVIPREGIEIQIDVKAPPARK